MPTTAPSSRRRPGVLAVLAISGTIAAVLWFMLWTVSSSNDRFFTAPTHEDDYYNLLAQGFRHGHLSLDCDVAPEMLRLSDPYDPAQRGELGLHDASYYQGRYYLYFGPAPVATVIVPFQLITGKGIQLPWLTFLFSVVGYLALATVLLFVWRRHFPAAGPSVVIVALLVLGCCTMVPSNLRRSHIWEMPISAGFCFASAAFAATYFALHHRRRVLWFTLSGLCVGLAVASRAVYVVATVLPVVALVWLWLQGRRENRWSAWPDRTWWRPALGCGTALGLIAVLLMLYNYGRFANPFEFGMKYQLTAIKEGLVHHFSPRYAWHDFRIYFANLARWSRTYPYVMPGEPPHPGPPGFLYAEWVTAVFPNLPFYALAVVGPFLAFRRRHEALGGWLLGLGATALLLSALLSCFVSVADRYMVDFLPAWALIATTALLALDAAAAGRRVWRFLLRLSCCAAAAVSVFVGVSASIESEGVFPHEAPREYRRVVRLFTSPLEWLESGADDRTILHLPRGGVVEDWTVELALKGDFARWKERCFPIVVIGRHEMADTIVLIVNADGRLQLGYDHWGDQRVLSPEFSASANPTLTLRVHYGELQETRADRPRRTLAIIANGAEVWQTTVPFFSGLLDRLHIGVNNIGATTCEKSYPDDIRARLISAPR